MTNQKDILVIFTEKADHIFADILKNYNLEESEEEFLDDIMDRKESRRTIIRDMAIAMAKKMIPEENLVELLQKHLGVPKEFIEKVVRDIKNKLLPLLLVYPEEKFDDPVFREEISGEVFGGEEFLDKSFEKKVLPESSYVKKIEITNVEENAEKMQVEKKISQDEKERILKKTQEKISSDKLEGEKGRSDVYREPIE